MNRTWIAVAGILLGSCAPDFPQRVPTPTNEGRFAGLDAVRKDLASSPSDPQVYVNAEAAGNASNPKLAFTLRNISKNPISVYPSRLPWGNPNSIEVAALTAAGEVIPSYWPIADPPPDTPATVSPGQTLKGDFDLNQRFENLEQHLKQTDILILWTYRFLPTSGGSADRVSGVSLLPRRAG